MVVTLSDNHTVVVTLSDNHTLSDNQTLSDNHTLYLPRNNEGFGCCGLLSTNLYILRTDRKKES